MLTKRRCEEETPRVKWSTRFATGVEQLDRQHEMLFRMSEDFHAALVEGAGERIYGLLLQSLQDYASAHFGIEEDCMHKYLCPIATTNKEAHLSFVAELDRFRERFDENGFRLADAHALVRFVDDWLAAHIGQIDVQLKPCVDRVKSS
jgi:hemerythrin